MRSNITRYWTQYERKNTKNFSDYELTKAPHTSPLRASEGVSFPWWRHQMETFSALLALCAGNSPVTGEFPAQSPVTRSFDVFFDLRLNKRLSRSKQWWGLRFQTLSHPLWRQCNDIWRNHASRRSCVFAARIYTTPPSNTVCTNISFKYGSSYVKNVFTRRGLNAIAAMLPIF